MAEQLALQQGLGDGRAVEGQERRIGAGAVLVDGAGDELLAGAALAGDQHRDVLRRDAADGLVDLAHRRGLAQDRVGRVGVGLGLGDDGRRLHPPGDLQGLIPHLPQLVRVEGLEEVVVGALLHRLDGRVGRPGHGDEDHGGPHAHLADLAVDIEAGLVGQVEGQQDDVGVSGVEVFEPRRPGDGDVDPVRRRGERPAHLLRGQVPDRHR